MRWTAAEAEPAAASKIAVFMMMNVEDGWRVRVDGMSELEAGA
jgi:hypothetical protein